MAMKSKSYLNNAGIIFSILLLMFQLLFFVQLSAQEKPILTDSEPGQKPFNVILLMSDDQGYGDVGFNGNTEIITPVLDDMARRGVIFSNFYAASPLCSPSRASCLTGRNPFRQGIFAAHTGGMRPAETTIAELLSKEGYSTGFFGKWHLGWVEPDKVETRGVYSPPWHHGYDEVFATKSAVPTWDPTKTPDGWTGFGSREDGSWGGSVYVQNGIPVNENLDGDDSRIIMDRVLPFVEQAIQKDIPFFATVWFHTPHEPVVAGPEYLAMYPDLPEKKKHFYGCITAMDEQIGRLREFLREKGIEENTIVFFCSDNGPSGPIARRDIASSGPFRGHKHQLWEGGLRVPSLMEWPGHIEENSVCKIQSGTVDYLPTILDLLGMEPFSKHPLDGISLVPALKGVKLERGLPLAFGYQRLYKETELFALINGDYKIVKPDDEEVMMLFNLRVDEGETNDISGKNSELFEKMLQTLEEIKHSWKLSREGADYTW